MGCTRIFVFIFLSCFIGWLLCDIDPNKTYTWYSGIWHGMFFIPNFIRSCIGDALYKANEYTTAYIVWWWITTVGAVCSTVFGYWGNRRSGY